jgi:hypothetical protein
MDVAQIVPNLYTHSAVSVVSPVGVHCTDCEQMFETSCHVVPISDHVELGNQTTHQRSRDLQSPQERRRFCKMNNKLMQIFMYYSFGGCIF